MNAKDLIKLRDKLKTLSEYRKNHLLETVDWERYPEQTDVVQRVINRVKTKQGHKIYVIFGGNRSGKSISGAMCTASVATQVKDSRVLLATIETKLSINVQQKEVRNWLPPDTILDGDYNPARGWRNSIIQGKNGYNILIKTYAQGYEAFQGDQFDLIWLDEECPYDIFQECLMRTVDRDGVILITFTSLQGFTRLVNSLWESDDPNVYTTILDLYLNPYIPKESKDLLMASIDPDEIESRIHGKPHIKEGLIYKEFGAYNKCKRFDYVELLAQDANRYEVHEGIDPHERTPHHWVRFLYDRLDNILYIVEEMKAPRESMLIEDFAGLIKAQKMERKGITFRPAFTQIDTASMKPEVSMARADEGQEDIHTIRLAFFKAGIQTILCTKDNAMGINEVKSRLKVLRNAIGDVVGTPKLQVFDDCNGVCWEFARYSWDSYQSAGANERNEMMNKPLKKDDHYMDVIKYECIKLANMGKREIGKDKYVARNPDIGY